MRPKSGKNLSEKKAREALAEAEKLYVLGINSKYVEKARKAVEARFGETPEIIIGEPDSTPALLVRMSFRRKGLTNTRMQFSTV